MLFLSEHVNNMLLSLLKSFLSISLFLSSLSHSLYLSLLMGINGLELSFSNNAVPGPLSLRYQSISLYMSLKPTNKYGY